MAVLFALLALVGWGTGDIVVAKVSRKIGNRLTAFIWLIASFILSSLYLPLAGPVNDWPMLTAATLLGFAGTLGTILYFQALEIGNASLVGTISGAFPIVTVPLSILLFRESLSWVQFAAIFLTLAGLILSTLHTDDIKNRNLDRLLKEKSILFSFATLLIWGIYWTLVRYPVEKIGWFWTAYPSYLFFFVMIFFKMVKNYKIKTLMNIKLAFLILLMSSLTTIANFAYNLGITYGYTSIVAPVAGSSPVLFVILSRFVFRDKLNLQQKIGIITTLTGIILIAFST
ncbi:MAG: hypothetical protein UV73_C0006G0023 [Candidatus Gottesmanbacteria bacterium GW2011_GWA2_43_14]|uniref:EamA domain-containing protein n=1 Tax=Candidatus Gottesmanbacteria bacterium GW2011_GWA2_43_14 TaxID=1618443 RepID=A0A0G1DJ27_9BACT|nr:MAG: hypothetical protein UV73_C0006G0023 [Candidatus Gottesmanbacteria bacterium GW2011_GWA2_43_14]